jgi:hypothetical protein
MYDLRVRAALADRSNDDPALVWRILEHLDRWAPHNRFGQVPFRGTLQSRERRANMCCLHAYAFVPQAPRPAERAKKSMIDFRIVWEGSKNARAPICVLVKALDVPLISEVATRHSSLKRWIMGRGMCERLGWK